MMYLYSCFLCSASTCAKIESIWNESLQETYINRYLQHQSRINKKTASADRTARRQFQATGQPVSWTQASDTMNVMAAALWCEVCATQLVPMRVGPFAFRYQGNGATPCQYIDTTRKAIDCAYNFATESFYIIKLCSRLFVLYVEIVQKMTNLGNLSPFWGS